MRRTDPSRPAKVPHLSFVHGRRGVDSCLSRQSGVEVFVRQPGILASNLGKMPWALGLAVGILATNAWGQSATTMTARELAKLSNRIEAVENATPGGSTTPQHEVTEAECRNRFPCKGCGCTLPGRSTSTGQLGFLGLGRRRRGPRAAT